LAGLRVVVTLLKVSEVNTHFVRVSTRNWFTGLR
jgi:hypothetical protein